MNQFIETFYQELMNKNLDHTDLMFGMKFLMTLFWLVLLNIRKN